MNSIFLKLNVFLAASVMMGMPMSVSAQVIYGLKNAGHFNSSKSGPFFIQVESFRSKDLAYKLKAKLAKHTHYPVQTLVAKPYYVVRIGPLPSAAAVRSFNGPLLSSAPAPKTLHSVVKKPSAHSVPKTVHSNAKHSNLKHPKVERSVPQSTPHSSIAPVPVAFAPSHQWFIGMDVGFLQSSNSKNTMTVPNGSGFPSPANVDEFSVSRIQPVMLDVQAGHRWNRDAQWFPSYALALRYEHVFSKNIHGSVTQFSLPEFRNYTYNWGIEADVVSVYSKIDIVRLGRFMPYFDVGLGTSFNKTLRYSEKALPNVTPRFSPDFASRSSSQFTYNVGAGLDYRLSRNFILSAGYDYQSFGNISSGFGKGPDWRNTKLNLGKFNTNMGLIGITYLFDNSMSMNPVVYK